MADRYRIFAERSPDRFPKLVNLYEKSKRDFWNESTAIDWEQELQLSPPEREALARVLSITYYGERAALALAGQLVGSVKDEEARNALACQAMEEARHVAALNRLLRKLDRVYPPSFFARRLLSDLLDTEEPVFKMVGMHLFIEVIANHSFHAIRESVRDPLTRQVLEYIQRDEVKHVAIGVLYVPSLLEELSTTDAARLLYKQLKWLTLGLGMVKDGYAPARVLGIDLAAAGQRAMREHHRVRAQLASRRGLLDVPGFERVVEVVGRWASPG